MITKDQALDTRYFHYAVGLRCDSSGGRVGWRRNGKTQTWKTRPDEFKVPVKWGLHSYSYVTSADAGNWYTPDECPVCNSKETKVDNMPGTVEVTYKGISQSQVMGCRFIAAFWIEEDEAVVMAYRDDKDEYITWKGVPGNWYAGRYFSGEDNYSGAKWDFATRIGAAQSM